MDGLIRAQLFAQFFDLFLFPILESPPPLSVAQVQVPVIILAYSLFPWVIPQQVAPSLLSRPSPGQLAAAQVTTVAKFDFTLPTALETMLYPVVKWVECKETPVTLCCQTSDGLSQHQERLLSSYHLWHPTWAAVCLHLCLHLWPTLSGPFFSVFQKQLLCPSSKEPSLFLVILCHFTLLYLFPNTYNCLRSWWWL
jgi:hypothetical protein